MSRQDHSHESSKDESEQVGNIEYYLERLKLLVTTGSSIESPEYQQVLEEIKGLPEADRKNLEDILQVKSTMKTALIRTLQEMDLTEDTEQSQSRWLDLSKRYFDAEKRQSEDDNEK